VKRFILAPALCLIACGGAPTQPAATGLGDSLQASAADFEVVHLPTDSPIVELRVVFRAGSAFDPAGKEGVSALLGRLMAEGGTEALTYEQLLTTLQPWAAQIAVQVDKEQLTFVGRVHKDHLKGFYPIFRDVLLRPRMGQADFERLRSAALTRLTKQIRTANDEELAKLVLESVLFEGTPYAHPTVGTEAALGGLKLADAQAQRARVIARNRVIVGVGGAGDAQLVDRLRADLSGLPDSEAPTSVPAPPAAKRQMVVVEQPGAGSTAIAFGHTLGARRDHADFPALSLALSFLGEHRQSHGVLFQRMREVRGMNYGDYAYAEAFIQEGWGRFPRTNTARSQQHFSVWIRPVGNDDKHFAVRIAHALLDDLMAKGVTDGQVKAAAGFLDGYTYLKQQTVQRRLGYALDDRFYGLKAPYGDHLRAGWGSLSGATVHAALKAHLQPKSMAFVVITPDAAAFAKAVAAETPSPKKYAAPKPAEVVAEDQTFAAYPLALPAKAIRVTTSAELFAR
jgi:zinc protease